ncbi:MAG: hypothetical protein HKN44_00725 [Ilumatobacter sp.]|nr:hypothetical protein [Ilumatobacter sp.]
MDSIRELEQLARLSTSDDPHTALVACRRLERDELPWLRERAVIIARRQGWAWRPIARLLGVSHQSIARRYRDSARRMPRHERSPGWGAEEERALFGHLRNLRLDDELASWERSGTDIVPW